MLVYAEQTHKTKPVFTPRHPSHKGPLTVKRLPNRRNKKACEWFSSGTGLFRCWWEARPCYVELRQRALRALCKQPVYFWLHEWSWGTVQHKRSILQLERAQGQPCRGRFKRSNRPTYPLELWRAVNVSSIIRSKKATFGYGCIGHKKWSWPSFFPN